MILVIKIEESINQKFFHNILINNLSHPAISNIVLFTNDKYLSTNNRITVFSETPTDSSCVEKAIGLFPNQLICWSIWNQTFNNELTKFNKIENTETFFITGEDHELIIFNPKNFVKKYSNIIDCLLGKKIDISKTKVGNILKLNEPQKISTISTTTKVSGTKYQPPLQIREVKKLDVIIVSVEYNDTLVLCLEQNKKYLSNITIVTSENDKSCVEICKRFGVNFIITDKMYEDGAEFNKGKAINEGIKSLENPDWILLMDADIMLTEEIRTEKLELNTMYGAGRYICEEFDTYVRYINGEIEIQSVGKKENDRGLGFFQLFNINSNRIKKEKPYSEVYLDKTFFHQDIDFKKQFDKHETMTDCLHLGKIAKNWRGRKSKKFINKEVVEIKSQEVKSISTTLKKSKRDDIKPKLAVLTTFFNPKNYINIKYNYSTFSKKIKEKADLFTIELSFDGEFYIQDENTIKIKGNKNNILWQKERLLNILLEQIPKEYTNIAWIDCDILFQNENWVDECNTKLQEYKVVQLYEWAERLNQKGQIGVTSRGLISKLHEIQRIDCNMSLGIPGFAWAARREVLEEIKFLDTQIIGGGDSIMCNAFLGNKEKGVVTQMNELWLKPFNEWADKAIKIVDQSVNYVSGHITHLYHGQMTNRKYNDRYNILTKYNFDPENHLKKTKNGLWQLKHKSIEDELKKYFEDRDEDDNIININTYFDKVFVINLDRRKDKLKKIDSKLKKLKIKYERFSAIDGSQLRFDNSNFIPGRGMIENNFALGCLLSHLEVIKISKQKGYKKILIFEDDVLISENINISIQNLRKIPSWKLLNLGASQYDWKIEYFDENFYYSKKTLGGFAYAVDESIYDELINLLESKSKSSDNLLTEIQDKYYKQCFTFYPYLCICDVSQSEIREGRDVIKHSKRMRWNLINNYI